MACISDSCAGTCTRPRCEELLGGSPPPVLGEVHIHGAGRVRPRGVLRKCRGEWCAGVMQAPTPDSDNNPHHVFRQRTKPNKPLTRRRRETQEESLEKLRAVRQNIMSALQLAESVREREAKKTRVNVSPPPPARSRARELLPAVVAARLQGLASMPRAAVGPRLHARSCGLLQICRRLGTIGGCAGTWPRVAPCVVYHRGYL